MNSSCHAGFSALASSDDDDDGGDEEGSTNNDEESEQAFEDVRSCAETAQAELETQPVTQAGDKKRVWSAFVPRSLPDSGTRENQVQRFRSDYGVSIQYPSNDQVKVSHEPVLSFEALLTRGVDPVLVAACQRFAAGGDEALSAKVWPTPVQAECWGLLIRGSSVAPEARSKPNVPLDNRPRVHGLAPEDIPVPSDDSDLDDSDVDAQDISAAANQYSNNGPSAVNLTGCCVSETHDVIGIAPTGSGKTLAYLMPLLADGLCTKINGHCSIADAFAQFHDLFALSFPLKSPGNVALLDRCINLNASGKVSELLACMRQVAAKAAADKRQDLAAKWRRFREQCDYVDQLAPRGLTLAPTREIAFQVSLVARALGAACCAVVGGVDPDRQRELLKSESPAFIVATPGRLRALCGEVPSSTRRRTEAAGGAVPTTPDACIQLSQIARLVLDEGDRLLDEGFDEDIQALSRLASYRHHSMIFSATWSPQTESLANVLKTSFVHITVAGLPTAISQTVELVPKANRGRRLRKLLSELAEAKVLVFVLFKQEAKALAKMLVTEGYNAFAMQGNMSQAARAKTLQAFRDAPCAVLVATDLAARGLDVEGVTHVINFSLGLSMDSYIHRIGRCGRAGRKGMATTFVTDGDERHASALVRLLEQAHQFVPAGLRDMAAAFERNRSSADFNGLTVKTTGQKGESRAVVKTASSRTSEKVAVAEDSLDSHKPVEQMQTAISRSGQKKGFKIWKGGRALHTGSTSGAQSSNSTNKSAPADAAGLKEQPKDPTSDVTNVA